MITEEIQEARIHDDKTARRKERRCLAHSEMLHVGSVESCSTLSNPRHVLCVLGLGTGFVFSRTKFFAYVAKHSLSNTRREMLLVVYYCCCAVVSVSATLNFDGERSRSKLVARGMTEDLPLIPYFLPSTVIG